MVSHGRHYLQQIKWYLMEDTKINERQSCNVASFFFPPDIIYVGSLILVSASVYSPLTVTARTNTNMSIPDGSVIDEGNPNTKY